MIEFPAYFGQTQGFFQGRAGLFGAPGCPEIQGAADRPVEQLFSLGGKGEDIGDKEHGHAVFIDMMDIMGPVQPAHRGANGGFGLAHHHRDAVDEQDHIRDFGFPVMDAELVGDQVLVIGWIVKINQANRSMAVVLAKGHGFFVGEPAEELFIGPDQAGLVDRDQDGPQFVDHLIGPLWLGFDLRVEADQGLFEVGFHQDFVDAALQRFRRCVGPFCAIGLFGFVYLCGVEVDPGELMNDVVLYAVAFVEGHVRRFDL